MEEKSGEESNDDEMYSYILDSIYVAMSYASMHPPTN